MEAKIYRDIPMGPDKLIGRIDEDGKVYEIGQDSERPIGWIDYDEGEVYDIEDDLMGWIEEDGTIIGYYDDDEEEDIGYVTEDGEIYGYGDGDNDIYLGKVVEMEDSTQGAAAMLLFYDFEDEEE